MPQSLAAGAAVEVPRMTTAGRIHRFGGPDVIEVEAVRTPQPGAGKVLVRVYAAGVGPWDAYIRKGRSKLAQVLPLTLGSDLSGLVAAAGEGVTAFAPDEEVFGVTNERFVGAYAEFAAAGANRVVRKPIAINHEQAASLPVVAVTAWTMLFERAKLTRGQHVLVHGAAGSVGSLAVQMARSSGATVIAAGRASDVGVLRDLGADLVVNYDAGPFEAHVEPVNAVIDTVGGEVQTRSFGVLKRGGVLVSVVTPPDPQRAAAAGVRAEYYIVNVTAPLLAKIVDMIVAGAITPHVGPVFPLAEARAAHELLECRERPRGKIVLRTIAVPV